MLSDPLKGCVRKGCQGRVTGPMSLYTFDYNARPGSHNDGVILFSTCRIDRIENFNTIER